MPSILNRKLRERIERFLVELPHCRDDDNRLMANVWQEEIIGQIGQEAYFKLPANSLLCFLAEKKLSSPESIRRIRQKIQELQPLLRGQTYQKRQKHQGEVKKEIRAFK